MIDKRHDEEEILLKVREAPPCPRCGSVTLLLAQFSYAWKNSRGEDVSGLKEAVLCPVCDYGDPRTAELLALFAVDGEVSPENLDVFEGLIAAWVDSVRDRTADEGALSAEFEQWKRGEL
ncbi:DUF6300 family protein [Streptomyces cucumeris]|uniref:DUF6300 family protein n=1 Tax=Streptomyces cucumeris TaxID=2962890 RepID=UPI003EBCEF37